MCKHLVARVKEEGVGRKALCKNKFSGHFSFLYTKIYIMRNSPNIGKEFRCWIKTKKWPIKNRSGRIIIQVLKHGWKVEKINIFIGKN